MNIDPKELKFHISVEFLTLIEKKLSQSKHKVEITDILDTIIEPL